ncbi:MAG: LCP family protein [Thermoleophilia bacterium]
MTPRREPPHRQARYFRVPRRRRVWTSVVGWGLWAVVGLVVAILAGSYIQLDDTLSAAAPDTKEAKAARAATKPVLPGRPRNILLIGSDARAGEADQGQRSDTLILVRMDQKRGFISMLSFPRDLYVPIYGIGCCDKINAAYSQSTETAIKTIEQLTGQPINNYVDVNFQGFAKMVNTVGGVYIDVDRRYFNQNLGTAATNYAPIDLRPGYQKLNGNDALDFVRYRHGDSDYARQARQQMFLTELKRQARSLSLGNISSLPKLQDLFGKDIQMDITNPRTFLSLLEFALQTPKNRIARVKVQGYDDMTSGGASIQRASQSAIDEAVDAWMNPEFEDETSTDKAHPPGEVSVTVLNGSGRLLAAEDLAQLLASKRGYRARVGGNARELDNAGTHVYYAPGFRADAQKIKNVLGPAASSAPLDEDEARGNEVVVEVGQDFTGALVPPPPPPKPPPADTVDTTSLIAPLKAMRSQVRGLRMMVPLKVASNTQVVQVRPYKIGDSPAIKIVFATGYQKYWGIEMTTMKNPPILQGKTGSFTSGGREYLTYYDGKNLQRLAFQRGNVTYWVSNTLDNDLSAATIQEIAKSMRPFNRATLPKGRTDTAVSVSTEDPHP